MAGLTSIIIEMIKGLLSSLENKDRIYLSIILMLILGVIYICPHDFLTTETRGDDLSGEWRMINTVEYSEYDRYKDIIIVWEVYLNQDGTRVVGHATKIQEGNELLSGSRKQVLKIEGNIKGDKVNLTYREGNNNTGQFEYSICSDLNIAKGRFESSAANSEGSSIAYKIK